MGYKIRSAAKRASKCFTAKTEKLSELVSGSVTKKIIR